MKRLMPVLALAAALVLVLAVAACGSDDDESSDAADIVDTAVAAGDFTTLASLLETTGLVDTLKEEGPYTVFAPTDAAFDALPAGTLDQLGQPENAEQLESILLYHVAEDETMSSDLSDGMDIETVQGGTLTVAIGDDGTVSVGDATVTQPDVEASNGVIHVIDSVLLPSS